MLQKERTRLALSIYSYIWLEESRHYACVCSLCWLATTYMLWHWLNSCTRLRNKSVMLMPEMLWDKEINFQYAEFKSANKSKHGSTIRPRLQGTMLKLTVTVWPAAILPTSCIRPHDQMKSKFVLSLLSFMWRSSSRSLKNMIVPPNKRLWKKDNLKTKSYESID